MAKKDDVTHDRAKRKGRRDAKIQTNARGTTKRKGRKDAKTINPRHRTCLRFFAFAPLRPLRLIALKCEVLFQKPVEPRYGVIELFGVDMESVNGVQP